MKSLGITATVGITNDGTKPRHLAIILSHHHGDCGIETNLCGEELAANVLSHNTRHVWKVKIHHM
jgi:hypothetical protein